jgi:hypothetical protein
MTCEGAAVYGGGMPANLPAGESGKDFPSPHFFTCMDFAGAVHGVLRDFSRFLGSSA